MDKDYIKQTMNEALSLHIYLLDTHGIDVFVSPILVFTNRYASVRFGDSVVREVKVIGLGWLNKVIQKPTQHNFNQEGIIGVVAELVRGNNRFVLFLAE